MSRSIPTMVVGVAELDPGEPVLRYGLELSERLGAPLHLVHAYAPPDVLPAVETAEEDRVAPPVPFPASGAGIDLEGPLKEGLRRVLPEPSGTPRVVPHLVTESPARALLDVGDEVGAQLILVGATRTDRAGGILLGTTPARTVRSASVPVLVLREPPAHPGTRVLLTTDLSPLSLRACRAGLELVRSLFGSEDARIRCLLAVFPGSGELPTSDSERLRREAEAHLGSFVRELSASGIPLTGVVRAGSPVDEIQAEASEWPADLVVLGTHGRSGLSRLLMGSVAEAAVRDLPCSVLVIPSRMFDADNGSREPPG